jgi:hypothetical protein
MTSQAYSVHPPRIATWLVSLFAPTGEEAESILGDLQEEFPQLASKSGIPFARKWYWRQTMKTIAHLFGAGFRDAPWSVAAAVVGGFLLLRFVTGLPDKLLSAVTDRYLAFWSTHFKAYIWMLNGMGIAHLTAVTFAGCVVALVAKGREMVATITLALVICALHGSALVWIGMHQPIDVAWILWSCADPLAIVLGGAIVRSHRSAAKTLPSGA